MVRICNTGEMPVWRNVRDSTDAVYPGTSLAPPAPHALYAFLYAAVARGSRRPRPVVPELPHRWYRDGSGPSLRELPARVLSTIRACLPSRSHRMVGARDRMQCRLLRVR